MCGDLRERLLDHLYQSRLFEQPGLALLAVSGGLDSVALLDLMASVAPEVELELAVAHVDHGIARESAAVVQEVTELARRYGLPYYIETLALGSTASETLARRERYGALRTVQRRTGARYLVTAHHADDQVETVLFRFLKGTGMAGLAGIPPLGPEGLVRPLLPFRRDELVDWLSTRFPDPSCRPAVFDDPANMDERHDRSWLRQRLLPLLRERFGSGLDRQLLDVAAHAARERAAWSQVLRALPELGFRRRGGLVEVARGPLERYDKVLSEGLLRAVAREAGCPMGARQAARLLEFVTGSSSGHAIQLGSGWEAELAFGRLRILRVDPGAGGQAALRAVPWGGGDDGSARWNGWEFLWRREPADVAGRGSFTTWITPGIGEIRVPRAGDRMLPLGGIGRRRVRRLLMEAKVPSRERRDYPVVVRGSDILWVPGVCRSADAVPRAGEPAVRLDARATGYS